MAFNVNEFITGYMEYDGFRPNLFEVSFTNFISSETLIRAKSTSIPSSSIGSARTSYFGRTSKFAGNRSFPNWTATFLMDEPDFALGIRGQFETWMARINKHQFNQRVPSAVTPQVPTLANINGYFSDITLNVYSKNNTINTTYTLWYAFPTSVSAISLDWGANDSIAEFSVTFAYQWWEKLVNYPVEDTKPINL